MFDPGGQQRGLVEHVGQVGAGEARRTACHREQVDVGGHRLATGVHLQDLLATPEVGGVDADLAVEPARAKQRRVEDVGTVGRRDQDDAATNVEAVHLHQQLVEGLLALVVAAAHAGTAVSADGVDLVDEHDGGGVLLGLLEQVAHTGGADTDEHLDEVGSGDRVERHARLTRDGAGEQRLAGAGLAVEQDTLGDLGADGLELGRLLQELLDLAELLDRLLAAGHVGEGGLRHVLADQLGLGLGELHHPAAAALHLVHQEDEQQHDQREGEQGRQDLAEQAGLGVLDVELLDLARVDLLLHLLDQADLLTAHPRGHDLLAVVERGADLLVTAVDEGDLLDLAGVDVVHHLRRLDLGVAPVGHQELQSQQDTEHGHRDPQPRATYDSLHRAILSGRSTTGRDSPQSPSEEPYE